MQIRNFTDIQSFLFDNVSIKQTIFKNTFWLAVAEGVSKLLKLILLIYVARILGATEYGKFSFVLAFIGLFTVFISLGLPSIIVRELSQGKEREKDFLSLLSLRIILSLVVLILISIGSFFITSDPLIRKVIWILALYTIFDSFAGFLNYFFRARQKMEYEAWGKILRVLILTGFGFFIIFLFPSIENLSFAYLFASILSLIFILIFFHFKIQSLKLNWDKSIWQKYLFLSWPIALAGACIAIYGQIDSVIMGHLNQITETGWYNAAYRVIGAALIPIGLISTSFYPALSKAFKESKEEFSRVWGHQMIMMISLAIPIVVGGIILAPKIIDFVYDPSFSASIPAFQILLIMAGIYFFQNPFNQVLIIFNQQKKFLLASFIGVITNLILNLILIPRYSLYGAAIAAVATSFLVLLLFAGFSLKFTSVKFLNLKFLWTGILAIFSASIMFLVISNSNIYNLHVVYLTIIGAATYFSVFFILNYLIKHFGFLQK